MSRAAPSRGQHNGSVDQTASTQAAPYSQSAPLYDLIYGGAVRKNYAAESAHIDQAIRARNPAAATLLDVACGTGRHLEHLRKRYTVAGLDASPDMLSVARQRLRGVPLHLADMRDFDLPERFDAVTCLFSSIGYLTTEADLRRAIAAMARHLAPAGVLVIDGWLRPDAWEDGHRMPLVQAEQGDTLVVRLTRSSRRGSLTTIEFHDLVHSPAGIRYFVERHLAALMPTAAYVAAAEAAGLRTEVHADWAPGRDRVIATRTG